MGESCEVSGGEKPVIVFTVNAGYDLTDAGGVKCCSAVAPGTPTADPGAPPTNVDLEISEWYTLDSKFSSQSSSSFLDCTELTAGATFEPFIGAGLVFLISEL